MNFIELMNRYDIPIRESGHHHCRSGWVQINCPFCGMNSNSFHMGYNLEYRYVNCWKCGQHDLASTLVRILPSVISVAEARRIAFHLPRQKTVEVEKSGKLVIPKGLCDLKKRFKRYLKNRGFNTMELDTLWGISCFSMLHSETRFHNRIFIPITLAGEVVSWTTRSIEKDAKLRYLSASTEGEAIPHKTLLYGEDYARHAIIIVEGPLDVWRIGPGAVATFGTSFTADQVHRMTKYPRRIVCYDNEPAAQRQAMKLVKLLSPFPGVTANAHLDAEDPGEASQDELKEIRKFAFS